MHDLIKSMKDHAGIPSTFDGQIPEFAFHTDTPRILACIRQSTNGEAHYPNGEERHVSGVRESKQ
jgi:hypothetical protein